MHRSQSRHTVPRPLHPLGRVASRRAWPALALLALVGLALLPAAAGAAYLTGNNARTLTHESVLRSYNVYAPPGYDGLTAVPLVVDLHGFTSTAAQQQSISGWQARADLEGFLVVYPDGLDNSWNAGLCCGASVTNDVDDVGFIRAVVLAIQAEGNVDASRIYATGLSNGGAMTHRLACEAADVFAAAAPLAFPVPFADFATECTPSEEIPVLMSMGYTDSLVSYTGSGSFVGAQESFEAWRAKQSCGPDPTREHLQLGGSLCVLDPSCANGTQVGLCSIRGSDLGPGLEQFDGHILYLNDDGIVMSELIWEFFETGSVGGSPAQIPALGGPAWLGLALLLAGGGGWLRRRARGAHAR